MIQLRKMQNIAIIIENRVTKCLNENLLNLTKCPPKIIVSKFAGVDYYLNNLVPISKINKTCEDTIISIITNEFKESNIASVSVSGKYVNFSINKQYLADIINTVHNTGLMIKPVERKQKIIVDYSSPNIAKDMHVGHLRSTIIGDSLANFYEIIGHEVVRVNHLGDFGLQFGMIIQYVLDNNMTSSIADYSLQTIYTNAKKIFDSDKEFEKKARMVTVELQKGDNESEIVKLWKKICEISKSSYYDIYKKLEIKDMIEVGESFYVKFFDSLIEELKEKKMLDIEDGRCIVKTPAINKSKKEAKSDDDNSTLTIVKSDGGFTYDTTDLAAIRYRLVEMKADTVYYVVDSGQASHFKQIFYVAEKMGWLKSGQKVEHINFGIIKGEDGKRIRSRSGETPKLIDLLDEAVTKTTEIMVDYKPELIGNKKIFDAIAYGSIKYADMASCRTSDYVYSHDRMLNFKGNTMLYIMYGFVRAQSINRNNNKFVELKDNHKINVEELNDSDMTLIKQITQLPEIIDSITSDNMMHTLCRYMYEITDIVGSLYATNRCVNTDADNNIISINKSRVMIFKLVSDVMKICYKIIGITPIEHM